MRITIQSPLLILLPKPRVLEISRHDNAPLCCVYCVHIPTTALAPHEIHRRASNWMAIVNSLALYAVVVVFSMDDQTIWHEPSRQPQSVLYNRPLIRESILNQWLVGEQCSRIQICGILHDKLGCTQSEWSLDNWSFPLWTWRGWWWFAVPQQWHNRRTGGVLVDVGSGWIDHIV